MTNSATIEAARSMPPNDARAFFDELARRNPDSLYVGRADARSMAEGVIERFRQAAALGERATAYFMLEDETNEAAHAYLLGALGLREIPEEGEPLSVWITTEADFLPGLMRYTNDVTEDGRFHSVHYEVPSPPTEQYEHLGELFGWPPDAPGLTG